jgi:CRISPR-associated protein Cmr4
MGAIGLRRNVLDVLLGENVMDLIYLYLIAPLHTGGTTQEGNLLGIARESHTNLPYVPSSTIRGRIRASASDARRCQLFGNDLDSGETLTQGDIWIGDGSILWLPVPSLSHGVVWVSSPLLLRRWARYQANSQLLNLMTKLDEKSNSQIYSTNFSTTASVYLKDAILKTPNLDKWDALDQFIPTSEATNGITKAIVLPDQHCATLIQMSLWRQVKIKLDEHKTVDGGFRYEEAIPPDTLMYLPWGITSQANGSSETSRKAFQDLLSDHSILQIGGQESLGRGFVQQWLA